MSEKVIVFRKKSHLNDKKSHFYDCFQAKNAPYFKSPRKLFKIKKIIKIIDDFFYCREMDLNHRRQMPADLQSAPFGRSGIPAHCEIYYNTFIFSCQYFFAFYSI